MSMEKQWRVNVKGKTLKSECQRKNTLKSECQRNCLTKRWFDIDFLIRVTWVKYDQFKEIYCYDSNKIQKCLW